MKRSPFGYVEAIAFLLHKFTVMAMEAILFWVSIQPNRENTQTSLCLN
ncbi:hypothetical protein [Nostoc sp. PCC 7524]|nr:hypothetical protein [Nostoc sp. PCC 7524]